MLSFHCFRLPSLPYSSTKPKTHVSLLIYLVSMPRNLNRADVGKRVGVSCRGLVNCLKGDVGHMVCKPIDTPHDECKYELIN